MTENEVKLLQAAIADYDARLSNDGCNDLPLPNTDENWELICTAYKAGCGGEDFWGTRPSLDKPLYTQNYLIYGFLFRKLINSVQISR